MSESLLLGALLAIVGGFFDAYTYLCRGGVFANAQTGNIVLLGLRIAEGQWTAALTYLVPIFAFAFGVVIAEIIKRYYKSEQGRNKKFHWRQVVVLAEVVLVAAGAFMPQTRNMMVNSMISFVCALQVESFRKVRGNVAATTMCTGNLRSGTEQLVVWRQTGDRAAWNKMLNYYMIILYFVLGAIGGSLASHYMGDRALLLAAAMLFVVFLIMFIEEEREELRS